MLAGKDLNPCETANTSVSHFRKHRGQPDARLGALLKMLHFLERQLPVGRIADIRVVSNRINCPLVKSICIPELPIRMMGERLCQRALPVRVGIGVIECRYDTRQSSCGRSVSLVSVLTLHRKDYRVGGSCPNLVHDLAHESVHRHKWQPLLILRFQCGSARNNAFRNVKSCCRLGDHIIEKVLGQSGFEWVRASNG